MDSDSEMSYTELESGYQGLKQSRPGFYVGHDGNLISMVSAYVCVESIFAMHKLKASEINIPLDPPPAQFVVCLE